MKKLLLILCLVIPVAGWSQSMTISAVVRDSITHENLGFASVGIKGIPIGTISNDQGEFDFHIPIAHRNDTMVISMIGYENFEAPIYTLLDTTHHTFYMVKSQIKLQEIVVSDTLSGGDVLRIALSRIKENYPMQPFLMDGFYRDTKKVGGTYFSLLEAAVKIFDENYEEPRNKSKLRERVRLVEVRKSYGYESKYTKYFDQDNLLEDLLLNNFVRYYHFENNDAFLSTLSRDSNSVYDGNEMYVVTHQRASHLKIYVDKTDFAILHVDYSEEFTEDNVMEKRKNLVSKFMGHTKSIGFRKVQGKVYLNFINMTSRVNWYDMENNSLKFETEVNQQLLINQIYPNTKERIASTQKMRNYGLQYQDQPYNKEFWEKYNVIKETPLDKKVIADLEKLAPLENQFEDN